MNKEATKKKLNISSISSVMIMLNHIRTSSEALSLREHRLMGFHETPEQSREAQSSDSKKGLIDFQKLTEKQISLGQRIDSIIASLPKGENSQPNIDKWEMYKINFQTRCEKAKEGTEYLDKLLANYEAGLVTIEAQTHIQSPNTSTTMEKIGESTYVLNVPSDATLRFKFDTYVNWQEMQPNLVSMGDLRTTDFLITKDPQNRGRITVVSKLAFTYEIASQKISSNPLGSTEQRSSKTDTQPDVIQKSVAKPAPLAARGMQMTTEPQQAPARPAPGPAPIPPKLESTNPEPAKNEPAKPAPSSAPPKSEADTTPTPPTLPPQVEPRQEHDTDPLPPTLTTQSPEKPEKAVQLKTTTVPDYSQNQVNVRQAPLVERSPIVLDKPKQEPATEKIMKTRLTDTRPALSPARAPQAQAIKPVTRNIPEQLPTMRSDHESEENLLAKDAFEKISMVIDGILKKDRITESDMDLYEDVALNNNYLDTYYFSQLKPRFVALKAKNAAQLERDSRANIPKTSFFNHISKAFTTQIFTLNEQTFNTAKNLYIQNFENFLARDYVSSDEIDAFQKKSNDTFFSILPPRSENDESPIRTELLELDAQYHNRLAEKLNTQQRPI